MKSIDDATEVEKGSEDARTGDQSTPWVETVLATLSQRPDAADSASLTAAFRRGNRAFLLNPPGDTSGDADVSEMQTVASILRAVSNADLEKVVAASTYDAQPGVAVGDLSTLWTLEAGFKWLDTPAAINRGAYYMSNWLAYADAVREGGRLPSLFPADHAMPMVAPEGLGVTAAGRLLSSTEDDGVCHVEGPKRYTPADIAHAFAIVLDRDVRVETAPRDQWTTVFKNAGFSDQAAQSYARMTAVAADSEYAMTSDPIRGRTTLSDYIANQLKAA